MLLFISSIIVDASFIITFVLWMIGSYILLIDDYKFWQENRNFKGLNSEDLIELIGKLKVNRFLLIIEFFGICFSMAVVVWMLFDVLNLKVSMLFLQITLPLCLFFLVTYRIKVRMRKSIEIFKGAERTH